MLFIGTILPVTFAFHYFHPWDRVSLFFWVATIWAIHLNRPALVVLLVMLGTAIKFDALVLPGLYFLAWISQKNWFRVTCISGIAFSLSLLTIAALIAVQPGGIEDRELIGLIEGNIHELLRAGISHPFTLIFLPLLLLCAFNIRQADRFDIASLTFACGLLTVFFTTTHFRELRAQMMVAVLLLPLALLNFSRCNRSEAHTNTMRGTDLT